MSTSLNVSAAQTPRVWALAVLVGAPSATIVALLGAYAWLGGTLLAAAPLWMYMVVALVMWSPLPFSLPAVLLERDRDAALPGFRGPGRLLRGLLLMPYMLTRSPARVEFLGSLVGFVLALVVGWPYVS